MDYKELKLGKYGIPTWDGFSLVILQAASTNGEQKSKELREAALKLVQMPVKLKELPYPDRPDTKVADNRMTWTIGELRLAGMLERPRKGVYHITQLGREVLEKYGKQLNREIIHNQPLYIEHLAEMAQRNQDTSVSSTEDDDEPDDTMVDQAIDNQVQKYNN